MYCLILLSAFSLIACTDSIPLSVQNEFAKSDDPIKTREVEIVAPAISCFSRFDASLKNNIQKRYDWVHSVQVKTLGKKEVKVRPKFDFGPDVLIRIKVDSKKTARELASVISKSGYYLDTQFWVIRSGFKMKDIRNRTFDEVLKNKP